MIFQEPFAAFSPVYRIGKQMIEAVRVHERYSNSRIKSSCLEMLKRVGVPDPERLFHQYPHQLSGGLLQRALIAMALLNRPKVLLADEPTTALDVTTQGQILRLLKSLHSEMEISILYISHDLDVIAAIADTVYVLYLGKVVERGTVDSLFSNPCHPYTRGLLGAIPKFGKKRLLELSGYIPVNLQPPAGCGFVDRCPSMMKGLCDKRPPAEIEVRAGHFVRCFLFAQNRNRRIADD